METDQQAMRPTALVTGAARRIGREIALALAARDCDIVLHCHRSRDAAEETAAAIRERGVECLIVPADLSRPVEASRELFHKLDEVGIEPSYLINSASLFERGTLFETTADLWQRQFAVNLQAPFFLAREFALRRQRSGREGAIVNLCDAQTQRPVPGHDAYLLTKTGLAAMTKMLALELAPSIRVNAVAPGAVLPAPDDPLDHARRAEESIPLRRSGTPADVVQAVLFLLDAQFVTGEVLTISGGEEL
jgi:pteridine reductase